MRGVIFGEPLATPFEETGAYLAIRGQDNAFADVIRLTEILTCDTIFFAWRCSSECSLSSMTSCDDVGRKFSLTVKVSPTFGAEHEMLANKPTVVAGFFVRTDKIQKIRRGITDIMRKQHRI